MRKEGLRIAVKYARDNVSDSKKEITKEGFVVISNKEKAYVIDPSKISIGCIDQDTINDAIVTLYPFENNYEVTSEHLVLMTSGRKLVMVRAMESDMKIISIEDGIITAEIPEHSRNSPLFNCPSCWDVVKYKFINGELVEVL